MDLGGIAFPQAARDVVFISLSDSHCQHGFFQFGNKYVDPSVLTPSLLDAGGDFATGELFFEDGDGFRADCGLPKKESLKVCQTC
jgi:hypothetical protein